jgi:hypothetical protein
MFPQLEGEDTYVVLYAKSVGKTMCSIPELEKHDFVNGTKPRLAGTHTSVPNIFLPVASSIIQGVSSFL